MSRTADWLAQASGGDADRLADAVDGLLAARSSHEVIVWRVKAEAFGARMVLAERVIRSLHRRGLTLEQRRHLDAWAAEHRRQTEGAA